MQYLHDNLNMYTIYMGGKIQYIGNMSPLNPYYLWEAKC